MVVDGPEIFVVRKLFGMAIWKWEKYFCILKQETCLARPVNASGSVYKDKDLGDVDDGLVRSWIGRLVLCAESANTLDSIQIGGHSLICSVKYYNAVQPVWWSVLAD